MERPYAGIRLGLLPLIARLLLIAEFLIALNGKVTGWSGQAQYMAAHGMHFIPPLLGTALVIEALGPTCLALGLWPRTASAVLLVYLGIVTVRLHNFWRMDGMAADANMTEFFKNLGMMGGLLMIVVFGPGTWSLDRVLRERRTRLAHAQESNAV